MRMVYAVMAHAQPDQLGRLIDTLLAPASDDRVVLHIDARSALWRQGRARFASHPSGRLTLVADPAQVIWGHASLVEAQRRLLRCALAAPFDHFHLISGNDWPITTRAQMVADLANEARDAVYLDLWSGEQANRMDDWWFDTRRITLPGLPVITANAQRAQTRLSWIASRWAHRIGLHRPRYDAQAWLKGSGWYSLPWDAALVLEREMSALIDQGRLRLTSCADEHVAPTVLARRFAGQIRPARRYIDWSSGGNHPRLLRGPDRDALLHSGAWFARKVDAMADDFFYGLPPF
ncbi:beta-1,6-N-acetylglucosaminyltransferase [Novosphingobium sp.]|uniref:beta-1,6-N-acetylglucosaminyltransferase n=1 Tax=Novosphingobium sp. TaxID=1874826 RepID=UPI00333F6AD6